MLLKLATEKTPKYFPQEKFKKNMVTNFWTKNGNKSIMVTTDFFEKNENSLNSKVKIGHVHF